MHTHIVHLISDIYLNIRQNLSKQHTCEQLGSESRLDEAMKAVTQHDS